MIITKIHSKSILQGWATFQTYTKGHKEMWIRGNQAYIKWENMKEHILAKFFLSRASVFLREYVYSKLISCIFKKCHCLSEAYIPIYVLFIFFYKSSFMQSSFFPFYIPYLQERWYTDLLYTPTWAHKFRVLYWQASHSMLCMIRIYMNTF